MSTKSPTDIDRFVGQNIKRLRIAAGISQESLGEKIGVTFQQVQKYEKGMNRLPPGRLVGICTALGVKLADIVPDPDVPATALPLFSNDALKGAAIIDRMTADDRALAIRILRAIPARGGNDG